ncbi:FtsW/RodA/SpoVE family cell cycle protein [Brochothrix campestris]|uniref:FtsW/RodA/SpoVE family cell division protein n=1 Tax=Brochothrix campestris FSL F6-1037 TaxID=1265861 RepID=W7CYG4_9LIST|nr:FtsW/RodA/SpoVE family cell cycle protein [Brochothrix campestris]EUJ41790.1 FtsW/RodA/SpoVE family cell division protein [Brochothrix campestris FSL F6-1037]
MKNEAVKSEAGFLSANIIISIVVLYLVSVTMIYLVTKSFNLVIMQTLWYIVGSVGIAIIRLFDTKLIEKYAIWLYFGGILSLVAVLLFGSNINGAQRWLKFGPVSLQTSEFMKIFLCVVFGTCHRKASSDKTTCQ